MYVYIGLRIFDQTISITHDIINFYFSLSLVSDTNAVTAKNIVLYYPRANRCVSNIYLRLQHINPNTLSVTDLFKPENIYGDPFRISFRNWTHNAWLWMIYWSKTTDFTLAKHLLLKSQAWKTSTRVCQYMCRFQILQLKMTNASGK